MLEPAVVGMSMGSEPCGHICSVHVRAESLRSAAYNAGTSSSIGAIPSRLHGSKISLPESPNNEPASLLIRPSVVPPARPGASTSACAHSSSRSISISPSVCRYHRQTSNPHRCPVQSCTRLRPQLAMVMIEQPLSAGAGAFPFPLSTDDGWVASN